MIQFDLDIIQIVQIMILPVILPILVGLVTTRVTSSGARAVLLAALSLVTSLLTEIVNAVNNNTAYDLGQGLLLGMATFAVAVAMHYGLLKPTGVSAKAIDSGRTAE